MIETPPATFPSHALQRGGHRSTEAAPVLPTENKYIWAEAESVLLDLDALSS